MSQLLAVLCTSSSATRVLSISRPLHHSLQFTVHLNWERHRLVVGRGEVRLRPLAHPRRHEPPLGARVLPGGR